MCGICGYIRFDGGMSDPDHRVIGNMNARLRHRGPDAQDTLLFENVALGFSRLSIIGLNNGMQPIFNEDGSVVVICNGEVFNYPELKEELLKRGHCFRTASDIEVLVHLYEEKGMDLLDLLNGQFAFALYDKKKKVLFCARDHLGIIPFFYTVAGNAFVFGSEIKAILQHPAVAREVDPVGLDQILTFAGLISPRTMFKHIHSLENGHYLEINEAGKITKKEYWDMIFPEGEERPCLPEEQYVDELETLFEQSVRLRLRADVPTGIYLSGGLDSSMIAMRIARMEQGVKDAFSIDFVDAGLSETVYQQMVAAAGNYRLNRKTFFCNDIGNRLRQSIYHSECPVKETYNTASLSLSGSVAERGIKVVLSGEGADELFAGYIGYRFDQMRVQGLIPEGIVDKDERYWRSQVWGDEHYFYEHHFEDLNRIRRELYSKDMRAVFDEVNCLNYPVVNQDRIRNRNKLNKRSYIDYKLRLVDHLVQDHGDRMALANSIEVRYPFLDKHFAEYAASIPSGLKLKGLTEKYILKELARRFVPEAVVKREKFGFAAPGSPYLIQNDMAGIASILSPETIRKQGFFDPKTILELRNKYSKPGFSIRVPFENDILITVITFGMFLETFIN